MKFGLIGNPLRHSWSPDIHHFFKIENYSLWPLEEQELAGFFERRDFDGINVTIPYKSEVLKYLDEVDETVARIGATNCVVNDAGRLKGYNTDVIGMLRLAERHGMDTCGGEAAILGSGGASKAAAEVCRRKGWSYHIVSRSSKDGCITYDELRSIRDRITVLINTTPVGMMPHEDEMPVDPSEFTGLKYLLDVVANPLRTSLIYEAERLGVKASGGLEMLVAQALAADELFTKCRMDDSLIDECMEHLISTRRNIVLIGMPSAGKTTIGKMLAERLGRPLYDIDDEIVKTIGMPISDYFRENGEDAFRRIESDVCLRLQDELGAVIAAGGGVIKKAVNMRRLAHNGLIVWLDRGLEMLTPTDSRPLSSDMDALARLYEERRGLYERYSDVRIVNDKTAEEAVDMITSLMGL